MSNPTSVSTGLLAAGNTVVFNGRSIINGFTLPPGSSITLFDGTKAIDAFDNAAGTLSVHVNYRQALRAETNFNVTITGASGAYVMWGAS